MYLNRLDIRLDINFYCIFDQSLGEQKRIITIQKKVV